MENRFNDSTKRASRARRLTSALAVSLGLGLFAPGNALLFGQQPPQTRMAETPNLAQMASPAELSRTFINVAKRVKPAVVHINIVARGARQAGPGELPPSGPARRGTGSGVIISPDGYILTNNH